MKAQLVRDWFAEHSAELSRKYSGKHIAMVNDKIVSIGKSPIEVYKKAKERYPSAEISLAYIPTDKELATLLCILNM